VRMRALLAMAVMMWPGVKATAADGEAKGTLIYKGTTVTLQHAYFVKGPDAMDAKTMLKRLILSKDDLGSAIQACKTMNCVDRAIHEAMQVDFGAGPRLLYWITLNGDRVQYSGTAEPSAATFAGNDLKRLAGTLRLDDTSAGGPRVEVEFEAALLKEFATAR
jgi:hypothetical protein